MKQLWNKFLDLLFPRKCVSCGRAGESLCHSCATQILPHRTQVGKSPDGLDGFYFYASYKRNPVLQKVIKAGKYHGARDLNLIFGKELAEILLKNNLQKAVLVPVPLHWRRQAWRGFNQSELIAESIARITGQKILSALKRTRYTRPQAEIQNRTARLENLHDVFVATQKLDPKQIYVLIDDVSTTGATLRECAHVLRRAGAQRVSAITIAHE